MVIGQLKINSSAGLRRRSFARRWFSRFLVQRGIVQQAALNPSVTNFPLGPLGRIGLPAWTNRSPGNPHPNSVAGASLIPWAKMQKLVVVALLLAFSAAGITPVRAGGGDLGAGLVAGVVTGTIIGATVAGPRYYAPPPVYVEPSPPAPCYWMRGEPVWDGYRGVWTYPSVRVCE
jgi:hypothetical protein